MFRHAVDERKVIHILDRDSTLHSAAWAARLALTLAMMLMGMLCFSLTASPVAAVNLLDIRSYAAKIIDDPKEFKCFDYIITRESRWNPKANNPKSSAFGIAQILGETSIDPYVQLARALKYAAHRYNSMCHAKAFHVRKGWW